MKWELSTVKCSGFKEKTWIVHYEFGNGTRNGKQYNGDTRVGYIPDTIEGREVLALQQTLG